MSIRVKLLLSYAAMLVVPLLLMLMTALLLVFVFRGELVPLKTMFKAQLESLDEDNYDSLLKHTIARNRELLTDQGYLDDLAGSLSSEGQALFVRVDGQPFYVSAAIRGKDALLGSLPAYTAGQEARGLPAIAYEGELYTARQYNYLTAEGDRGSLFLLRRTDPLLFAARKLFPLLFVSLLFILVATHLLLTSLMSRRIIRPLLRLERAAGEITEGNLDFSVDIAGKDEIGRLGIAFENMRSRLQQSIRLQRQYEDNRKELITSISHDLRTPLTSIQGYVDGILEGVANSPEKTELYLQTISLKTAEMSHLIEELFLYSKLDLKGIPFHFEEVPLAAFAADWADELAIELEKRGARLEAEIEAGPEWRVRIDREKFKRVLGNIVQNSVKYGDKPELAIAVRVHADGDRAVLEVGDNGPGIPSEALPCIFDRFFRAEESRNAVTGGTGLGLAIAKQIMEGLGGSIEADSAPGQGTCIKLMLPAAYAKGAEK
ncbi:cell wall metabolism sensor histidine kinase WalK [Paenibacillus sp. P22]|uniref:sensor histidine kinase n=1 Tax=Paenibacillus sp. P22 TaxID=483908 RepID=UPI0004244551|nr:HAMP domain-containing sensor histidine kinase [Paenibacillus sp. P22]